MCGNASGSGTVVRRRARRKKTIRWGYRQVSTLFVFFRENFFHLIVLYTWTFETYRCRESGPVGKFDSCGGIRISAKHSCDWPGTWSGQSLPICFRAFSVVRFHRASTFGNRGHLRSNNVGWSAIFYIPGTITYIASSICIDRARHLSSNVAANEDANGGRKDGYADGSRKALSGCARNDESGRRNETTQGVEEFTISIVTIVAVAISINITVTITIIIAITSAATSIVSPDSSAITFTLAVPCVIVNIVCITTIAANYLAGNAPDALTFARDITIASTHTISALDVLAFTRNTADDIHNNHNDNNNTVVVKKASAGPFTRRGWWSPRRRQR
jgi:hypothetical protein